MMVIINWTYTYCLHNLDIDGSDYLRTLIV